jgi:tyrosyl-tRNA synthetase
MLSREIGPKLGYWKPVCVHHHMLMGLNAPPEGEKDAIEKAIEMKMSKSIPDSAIFMTDTQEDIARKMKKAYCPEKVTEENPVMEYCKYLVFEKFPIIEIKRPEKFGGDLELHSYDELVKVYTKGDLHPMDLKQAVAGYVNEMLEPVRQHFEKNKKAKKLFEEVQSFEVTR